MTASAIIAARVFTGTEWCDDAAVIFDCGRIVGIGKAASLARDEIATVETLPPDVILAPGFIDVQVNGGGGALLNDDPSLACIRRIAEAHRRDGGTTGLLPTLITDVPEKMQALDAIGAQAMTVPGVLGFHLEGPFLNPARKGVHREDFIRKPTDADLDLMRRFAHHGRSIVTLAPEMCGDAAIGQLVQSGLKVCAGHCEASYDEMVSAVEHGLSGITHLYNALAPLGGRAPGVIGAALDDQRLFCGLIADGHHVSPSSVRLAYAIKSRDRVMLVTDAMPTAASDITSFNLQGRVLTLVDGRLTAGPDTLGGAHLTMLEAVRRMIDMAGCEMDSALVMASRTPAAFLGLDNSHGRLAAGYVADLVAFDANRWQVFATWIGGNRADGTIDAKPQIEGRKGASP